MAIMFNQTDLRKVSLENEVGVIETELDYVRQMNQEIGVACVRVLAALDVLYTKINPEEFDDGGTQIQLLQTVRQKIEVSCIFFGSFHPMQEKHWSLFQELECAVPCTLLCCCGRDMHIV